MLSRLNLPNNYHVMCRNYSMYYSVNSLVSYEFYYLQDVSCQNLKYLLSFIKYSSFFQMNSTSHSHQLNYPINFYLYPKDQEHLLVIHVLSDQRGFILENEGAFAMISAVVWAPRFLCLFYIDRGFSGVRNNVIIFVILVFFFRAAVFTCQFLRIVWSDVAGNSYLIYELTLDVFFVVG